MIRTASLRLIVPLALLVVACSERPTGPPTDLSAATAASSSDRRDSRPELATIVWQTTTENLVIKRRLVPTIAGRAYGLVGLAQYAAVDAVDARGNGSAKTDPGKLHDNERRGAVAGASAQVLKYLFTGDVAAIETQVTNESAAGSADERAAFARGVTVGREMGDVIVVRGIADGLVAVWDGNLKAGADLWFMDDDVAKPPTPMGFQYAAMVPYFLTTTNQFRPPPRPMDPKEAVKEVIELVTNRTDAQAKMAVDLNLPAGTVTPLGDWDQIAATFIRERNMDERAAAHVYALLNAAAWDAVLGCWDAKYEYLVQRPWQVAPELRSTKGALNIGRPNHPSYPSGHSCVSGAAATVLEQFFPEHTTSLEQHVIDNGLSRIYAGIHYRMDCETGQQLGRDVAAWAIHYDHTNGLLAALLPNYRGNDDR